MYLRQHGGRTKEALNPVGGPVSAVGRHRMIAEAVKNTRLETCIFNSLSDNSMPTAPTPLTSCL